MHANEARSISRDNFGFRDVVDSAMGEIAKAAFLGKSVVDVELEVLSGWLRKGERHTLISILEEQGYECHYNPQLKSLEISWR